MICKYTRQSLLVAMLFLAISCDILRSSPFEVTEWTPGGGYHANPAGIAVSVTFSHDPDRASAEKNFSLYCGNEQVKGSYQWEGRKMIFMPFVPLVYTRFL